MAITVNAAFSESLRETVNLESGIITVANSSLNNLINIIMSFSRNVDPFNVYSEYKKQKTKYFTNVIDILK